MASISNWGEASGAEDGRSHPPGPRVPTVRRGRRLRMMMMMMRKRGGRGQGVEVEGEFIVWGQNEVEPPGEVAGGTRGDTSSRASPRTTHLGGGLVV